MRAGMASAEVAEAISTLEKWRLLRGCGSHPEQLPEGNPPRGNRHAAGKSRVFPWGRPPPCSGWKPHPTAPGPVGEPRRGSDPRARATCPTLAPLYGPHRPTWTRERSTGPAGEPRRARVPRAYPTREGSTGPRLPLSDAGAHREPAQAPSTWASAPRAPRMRVSTPAQLHGAPRAHLDAQLVTREGHCMCPQCAPPAGN